MALTDTLTVTDYSRFACNVSINQQPLADGFEVISVQVRQAYQFITSAQILLKQEVGFKEPMLPGPAKVPLAGTKISIKAKLDFEEIELFEGVIVKHTYKNSKNGTRLQITAKTKAINIALYTASEVFAKQSDKDIIDDIVTTHGCNLVTSHLTNQFTLKHSHLVKNGIHDWDFINIRAEANGLFVFTEKDTVTIDKPTLEADPTKIIQARYAENIFELELEQDDRKLGIQHELISFNLTSFEHEVVKEEATPTADQPRDMIKGQNKAINYRTFNEMDCTEILGAETQLKSISKLSGVVHIKANLTAKPGGTLDLIGFNEVVDGKYIITSVLTDYSQGGFNSYLQFGLHHESYASKYHLQKDHHHTMIVTGIVTKLEEDPDNLNRIQVKIAGWKDAQESVWARLSTMYAGDTYGLFWLPEINDEVLLGFMGNDFDTPIVLGSLFSPKKPPHTSAKDDNFEKVLITKKGMKWAWNDDKVVHEISTPNGNKIVISEEDHSITIEDENKNKIVMNDSEISLTGNKDITIKAGMNVKIEGIGVEISATGNTKIKGNPININ